MTNMEIGYNIKKIRTEKGMTQQELANLLNKSTITIRKWESNERTPNIETTREIANALGISVYELINNSYSQKNNSEDYYVNELLNLVESLTIQQSKKFRIQKAELIMPILNLLGIYIQFDITEPGDPIDSTAIIEIPKDNYKKVLFLGEFLDFMDDIYKNIETKMKNIENIYP